MKAIYIEWNDACTSEGWLNAEEDAFNTSKIITVGFLVEENSEQIVISASHSETTGNVLSVTVIPKGWIRKRRNIKL